MSLLARAQLDYEFLVAHLFGSERRNTAYPKPYKDSLSIVSQRYNGVIKILKLTCPNVAKKE